MQSNPEGRVWCSNRQTTFKETSSLTRDWSYWQFPDRILTLCKRNFSRYPWGRISSDWSFLSFWWHHGPMYRSWWVPWRCSWSIRSRPGRGLLPRRNCPFLWGIRCIWSFCLSTFQEFSPVCALIRRILEFILFKQIFTGINMRKTVAWFC